MLRNKFSIYYYVRPSKIEGKKGVLYLRIKADGKPIVLSIPSLKLYHSDFNTTLQRVNPSCELAIQVLAFMNEMNGMLNDMYIDFERKKKKITRADVEKLIPRIGGGASIDYPSLPAVWEEFVADQKKQVPSFICIKTYRARVQYGKLIGRALKALQLHETPVSNLSETDIENLQYYLLNKYSSGYTGRVMPVVGMILEFAIKRKYIEVNPYRNIRKIKINRAPNLLWLDPSELEALAKLDVSGDLEKCRDAFLFCCWTGLAIGDYELLNPSTQEKLIRQALSPKDIKAGVIIHKDSGIFLEGHRRKTGTPYRVPLAPEALAILSKYGGIKRLPYRLYKTGMHLNALGQMAGIKKKIRFHTARKTFANYLINEARMNPFYAIKIMGWSDIKESTPYVEVSDETLATQLFQQSYLKTPAEPGKRVRRTSQVADRDADLTPFSSGVFMVHKMA